MTLLWSSYFSFLVLVFVSNVLHFPVVKMFCLLKKQKNESVKSEPAPPYVLLDLAWM